MKLMSLKWEKHPANPVLPPSGPGACDSKRCMNPYVLIDGNTYKMYYSGKADDGYQRICLATAQRENLAEWTRHGVVLDLGPEGTFCDNWCVLPLVHRFGNRWHLYWTGREKDISDGLQSFTGIGLARSSDGIKFERYSDNPVITGDQTDEYPNNRGIAGGGTILEEQDSDGSIIYRQYYTLAVGKPNSDMCSDQEKHCAVCFSKDGIHWTDHRIVMSPRGDVPHEDAACAAPFVWYDGKYYRMVYSAIGTKWGYYSLAQAVSRDGICWERGSGEDNILLKPDVDNPDSWENQMVEYPSVVLDKDELILFYCGNGYGATGIGIATAKIHEE